MHAVSADTLREFWIGCDEQCQRSRARKHREAARRTEAFWRAKVPINNAGSTRQCVRNRAGIRRAHGIGEEIEAWNRRRARCAVEPGRLRR